MQFLFIFVACYAIAAVNGHGRLLEPPSRSSLFRFAYSDPMLIPYRDIIQPNYNDHELYCGGREVQIDNDGKCGVCGDPYHVPNKENEAGGKYALGIITRNYEPGQLLDVTVEITAAHLGYFEFRLCPWNNVHEPITHECLDQNLLTFESGETKWYLPNESSAARGMHHLKVQLPQHITCEQCVLQWRYRTGNSWGSENGEQGLGLGQQEEFYGCSDVSIGSIEGENEKTTTATTLVTKTVSSTVPTPSSTAPVSTILLSSSSTHKTSLVTTTTKTQSLPSESYPGVDCSQVTLGQTIYRDCHSFYVCAYPQYDPFVFACPAGTVCDPADGRCKHFRDVPSCT